MQYFPGGVLTLLAALHLESRVPRRVFWQRLAGALLMLTAIAFYATG